MKTTLFRVVAVLLCGCALMSSATASEQEARSWWNESIWKDPDRGFFWYPPDAPPPQTEKKKDEKPKTIYEMTEMEDLQKEIRRLKEVAIMNPSEQNIHIFLQAQNFVMNKAAMFADVSRRVVWANPDVDYGARHSPTNYSGQLQGERLVKAREQTVERLSETHAILFFARSDCQYCRDQAPILKGFQARSGMRILAISMDNKPIHLFPDAKPDNGISMIASGGNGVETVPQMFLIDRQTNQMIQLGTGVVAADELATRIRVLTETRPGVEF